MTMFQRCLDALRVMLTLALVACASDPESGAVADTATFDVPPLGDPDSTTGGEDDAPPAADGVDVLEPDPDTTPDPIHPALEGTVPADFTVRPGVEIVTAFGVTPGAALTLYDAAGTRLVSLVADGFGQVHFAYIPNEYALLNLAEGITGDIVKRGHTLTAGADYVLRDDSPMPAAPARASAPFRVLGVNDHPPTSLYEKQDLTGVHFGIAGIASDEDALDGFNYIEVRDGVLLSAMVRLPDPAFWGDGPYPTVVEYSGYSPSEPSAPDPGSRIATLLGYASVGVNMRGTGCSGGVFDIFSPAQHADGYDVIETVARQPWVLHGKVGMVGLSYPGISELYVAYTKPPGLAAITPLSVLADPWVVLRPGGIYNDGFTRQWLEQRDAEAASGGQKWTDALIKGGDTVCGGHQDLRNQNLLFEEVFQALEFYPEQGVARSLPLLVKDIEVPVYLTGGFQDEQTGPQFIDMLANFTSAPLRRFILYNGRHADGYSPLVLTRWWEFLEIYVARRVPRLPEWMRTIGADEFSKEFDSKDLEFEPDRFTAFEDTDYEGVKAAYETDPEIRILFESGGLESQPGAPEKRFERSSSSWPPPDATTRSFFLAPGGALTDVAPSEAEIHEYTHDPEAGSKNFFGPKGYSTTGRLWDIDWTVFPDGKSLSYLSPALTSPLVLGGPGFVELWLSSDAADVHVQVTLLEVRTDGLEVLLTTGWLRVGHRVIDEEGTVGNHIQYTYRVDDFQSLAPNETLHTKVPLPSVAHVLRTGSRLRAVVSTPGRDHGTWQFANPTYEGAAPSHRIALGGATPSALHLSVIPAASIDGGIPETYPACPGIRGQPCRTYVPSINTVITK